MPYASNADLPESVHVLPAAGQTEWRTIANNAEEQYGDDPAKVFATAWAALEAHGWKKHADGTWHKVTKSRIAKIDAARHLVFGWASVAIRKDGEQVEDFQGDLIDPPDLEDAAYDFVLNFGEANAEHQGETIGHLVESLVVTKEKLAVLGLAEDALPQGWWIGFHIPDEAAWVRVESGEYRMFSIEGTAQREDV